MLFRSKKEKDGGGGDGDNREFEWKRAMAAKEEIIQKLKKEVETGKKELEENKKKLKNLKQAPTNTSNDNILMLMKKVKKKVSFPLSHSYIWILIGSSIRAAMQETRNWSFGWWRDSSIVVIFHSMMPIAKMTM